MSTLSQAPQLDRTYAGIGFMVLGMLAISVNDVLIKSLAGSYPLHQIIFIRACIGLMITFVLLQIEGGFHLLRTDYPGLHLLRAGLLVFANTSFFMALATMPLAEATALYFVAPLIITVLSTIFLGERVGPRRIAALIFGFGGVLLMLWPQLGDRDGALGYVALLPIMAAVGYASMSILTRKLGGVSRASAMASYMQITFIIVGVIMFFIAGDGRYLDSAQGGHLRFILMAWTWPPASDWIYLGVLGTLSGIIGYAMSQAYRFAKASSIAPFEYILLPFATLWGVLIFGDVPGLWTIVGALVIVASGLFIVFRTQQKP